MATAITLSPKHLHFILQSINDRIVSEDARYKHEDPAEDAAGDYGNDLWGLKLLRDELTALQSGEPGTATEYECWFDPEDNGLSLLRFQDVQQNLYNGQLSDQAVLQYAFIAYSGEEAMAIHALRQGWAPYLPMGEAAPCPNCKANYYPLGYGDCWRCGHIG
jgi:hypothetical protein